MPNEKETNDVPMIWISHRTLASNIDNFHRPVTYLVFL